MQQSINFHQSSFSLPVASTCEPDASWAGKTNLRS